MRREQQRDLHFGQVQHDRERSGSYPKFRQHAQDRVNVFDELTGIAQVIQPVTHHLCQAIRVWYAVRPCQERSEFLVEADDDESSLEHCGWLQWAVCRL